MTVVDNVEKPVIDDEQKEEKLQYFGTGRRKTSTAKVKLIKGKGDIFVNSKPLAQYFTRECYQLILKRPLEVTELSDKFDVYISVSGGGTTGQVDAAKLGIARAILEVDSDFRSLLSKKKLLTRDPRMVERKKYGQKKARKRFQWTKR